MAETESPSTVSVIVPVFNAGDDLERCLAAISTSDFPVLECIVVDDGSTDGRTAGIAQRHGARLVTQASRNGPAAARNAGAAVAQGSILLFTDSDVVLHPDAIGLAVRELESDPGVSALIGSYDDTPGHPSFLSRYRNLYHHWNHQIANEEASTFWTGCGAIRREVFLDMGGFNPDYAKPSVEDIEFGYRLRAAGHRIRLLKNMHGTHLKHWKFLGMMRTDIFQRGIPWVVLLRRFPSVPPDLNLNRRARIATVLGGLFLLSLLLLIPVATAALTPYPWLFLPLLITAAIVWIQRDFFRLVFKLQGLGFAIAVIPMQVMFFIACAVSIPLGFIAYLLGAGPAAHS